MSFKGITSQFSHLPLLDTPYQMTREANVWLNGSEVNTQQMGVFFVFFFLTFLFPLAGDLVCSSCWIYEAGEAAGTQGHSSHHALRGSPSPPSLHWPSGHLRLRPQLPQSLPMGAGPARAGCAQEIELSALRSSKVGHRAGNQPISPRPQERYSLGLLSIQLL